MRFGLFACSMALAAACGAPPAAPDPGFEPPVILQLTVPSPALEGSLLEARVLGLQGHGNATLRLDLARQGLSLVELETFPGASSPRDGVVLFELNEQAVIALGVGTHSLEARLLLDEHASEPFSFELELVTSLPIELAEVPTDRDVFRNEVAVLIGDGIVSATEGTLTARFVGSFMADSGDWSPIDVMLPVHPLERSDRERGVVVLTTALGGLMPGTFEGTIQLRSTLRSGETTESAALPSRLRFVPPALFAFEPMEASLGQILRVRGGGFLGGPDHPTEATVLRIEGTFTPPGGAAEAFPPTDLVPRFVSGAEVTLELEAGVRDDALVSVLFGHPRGTFQGTATPITSSGSEELSGLATPFTLHLGAIRQVVHLRFLPGFYDSLRNFGLASAAPELAVRTRERIAGIFAEWNVDIRLEEPDDFGPNAYSILDIGGPDPNGFGLFGYDNSPGKDVGNLRLFDRIGGANAQTQSDGYPGYGGVFVDSFLYWSSHPGLPGERPPGAPNPDPLFDEVFDPVRTQPATRAEVRGEGSAERVAQVRRAIHALGGLIGETAAHELGHSFGMAQPYGPPNVYHNDFDGEGCLMDHGSDRPLGERMEESGFAPTRLCHDHPSYLDSILGR